MPDADRLKRLGTAADFFFQIEGWYPFACKSATADNARVWKSGMTYVPEPTSVSANARIRV
jgi:hypothetical protein